MPKQRGPGGHQGLWTKRAGSRTSTAHCAQLVDEPPERPRQRSAAGVRRAGRRKATHLRGAQTELQAHV